MDTPWKANRLLKGHDMEDRRGKWRLCVGHWDRTIDPYMALVIFNGVIVYTGLHPTLSSARQKCEAIYVGQKPWLDPDNAP